MIYLLLALMVGSGYTYDTTIAVLHASARDVSLQDEPSTSTVSVKESSPSTTDAQSDAFASPSTTYKFSMISSSSIPEILVEETIQTTSTEVPISSTFSETSTEILTSTEKVTTIEMVDTTLTAEPTSSTFLETTTEILTSTEKLTTTEIVKTTPKETECSSNGNFSVTPGICTNKYYLCWYVNGSYKKYNYKCPGSTLFSDEIHKCVKPLVAKQTCKQLTS